MLDATVPGSAYNTLTRTGWKVNGSHTTWTYKNPGTDPNGFTVVGVKTTPSKPGLVKLKAKGKNGAYAVHTNHLPLHATFILDPPFAVHRRVRRSGLARHVPGQAELHGRQRRRHRQV